MAAGQAQQHGILLGYVRDVLGPPGKKSALPIPNTTFAADIKRAAHDFTNVYRRPNKDRTVLRSDGGIIEIAASFAVRA